MGATKTELKDFKHAKKHIVKQFDVEIVRLDDVVEVDGVYAFTFSEDGVPLSQSRMETELINTIKRINS